MLKLAHLPLLALGLVACGGEAEKPAEAPKPAEAAKPPEAAKPAAPPEPAAIPAPADVAAPPADAIKTPSGLAYKVLTPGDRQDASTTVAASDGHRALHGLDHRRQDVRQHRRPRPAHQLRPRRA
jgi:hypothetical protein